MYRKAGFFLVVASCLALGLAWFVEHIMSVMPCELCLAERWPWRVLLVTGLVSLVLPELVSAIVLWLAVPVLLVSCVLAVCHAGVEWHWWPSPFPACHAPHVTGKTVAERLASMPLFPSKPCDAPTYLIPDLPVSMSVMGGGYAAAVLLIFLMFRRHITRMKRHVLQ